MTNKHRRRLSMATLTMVFCSCGTVATQHASACNLYVSPGGSDSNSGTSTSSPWKTAQHAFDSVQPGQTVCFMAGTYPMTVTSGYNQILSNSGTASNWVYFTNYPGAVAILEGNTRVQAAYAEFSGTPDNAPGLIFQGPTGQELGQIDVMYSHDITFNHVQIRDADYHAGFYQYDGYAIQLINSYIYDNGRPGFINTDQGIYWDATIGGGNLIANNVVYNNVACGIQLYPSPADVTVKENTVVGNGNYGMVLYGSSNSVVNNIFASNGAVANNPQLNIYEGTNHVVDSNDFWSAIPDLQGYLDESGQKVTNTFIFNPDFADAPTNDYQLLVGSPAISKGNDNYTMSPDILGVARGVPPGLGAYVYPSN
jgi:parallel beta-helix repeat protein